MSFPRYSKYKDSGVECLGEVPEHWKVLKLRRILLEHRQGYYSSDDYVDSGVKLLRITDLREFGGVNFSDCPRVEYLQGLEPFLLKVSDFVFARTGGAGTFGLIAELTEPIAYASYLIRFRFADVAQPNFLRHFFLSDSFQNAVKQNIHGGVNQNVHAEDIKNQSVALPPRGEQPLVVEFLDRETAKIDELVAEQQRLIELLKEKRQAVISHAVTKGLNPDAPMKPSGIEWLGDVPEHWRVAAVRFRYDNALGKMLDTGKITGLHLRPYLRVFDVQWGEINVTDLPQMDFDFDQRDRFRLTLGDLLINEGGSYPGRSAIWTGGIEECYFQKALHRLRPRDSENDTTRFLFYIMCWATEHGVFVAGGNESTIEHLPAEKLRKYRFAFPPMEEQQAIATFLDRETAKFDELTAEAQRGIDLLQERRTALISAAVTGKIDVRAFAERDVQ